MKQSSIEWLIDQLTEVDYGCINNTFLQMNNTLSTHIMKEIFEKAKAMHKEEITNAWDAGYDELDRATASPIKYYHETFNTKEK